MQILCSVFLTLEEKRKCVLLEHTTLFIFKGKKISDPYENADKKLSIIENFQRKKKKQKIMSSQSSMATTGEFSNETEAAIRIANSSLFWLQ